jgi:hypothetical protein
MQPTVLDRLVVILLPKRHYIGEMRRIQTKNDNVETNYLTFMAIVVNKKGKIPVEIAERRITVKGYQSEHRYCLKRVGIPIKSEKPIKIG